MVNMRELFRRIVTMFPEEFELCCDIKIFDVKKKVTDNYIEYIYRYRFFVAPYMIQGYLDTLHLYAFCNPKTMSIKDCIVENTGNGFYRLTERPIGNKCLDSL